MIQQKISSQNARFVAAGEHVTGTFRRVRLLAWHLAMRFWIRATGLITTSRAARRALGESGMPYVYGEFIVMAAFMTCASLLISAVASPLLYLAGSTLAYKIGLATAAAAAGVPVFQLLMTSPAESRPSALAAITASAYFVVGTPFGFLLMAWVLSLN
jgi:hypothetical protein